MVHTKTNKQTKPITSCPQGFGDLGNQIIHCKICTCVLQYSLLVANPFLTDQPTYLLEHASKSVAPRLRIRCVVQLWKRKHRLPKRYSLLLHRKLESRVQQWHLIATCRVHNMEEITDSAGASFPIKIDRSFSKHEKCLYQNKTKKQKTKTQQPASCVPPA